MEILSDISTRKPFFVEHEESNYLAGTEPMNLQEEVSVGWI